MELLAASCQKWLHAHTTPARALWSCLTLNWAEIVGEFSQHTKPLNLHKQPHAPCTLIIGTWQQNAFTVSQHTQSILEKINHYAGADSVHKMMVKPIAQPTAEKRHIFSGQKTAVRSSSWAKATLKKIHTNDLASALEKLAKVLKP